MSTPKKRTSSDAQSEFQQLAFKSGTLNFEIVQKNKDLALYLDTMRNLSFEFTKLQNEEAKEAELRASIEAETKAKTEKPELKEVSNG